MGFEPFLYFFDDYMRENRMVPPKGDRMDSSLLSMTNFGASKFASTVWVLLVRVNILL
jgi:hypothetical protein